MSSTNERPFNIVVFVTKKNGIYNDYWNPDNSNELMWYGQKSGARDHYVGAGSALFMRKKSQRLFTLIGYVKSKQLIKEEKGKASLYKLVIEKLNNPVIIKRADGDVLTANTILRKYGFPLEKSTMSQGIYAK